jgi:hypothetical protein
MQAVHFTEMLAHFYRTALHNTLQFSTLQCCLFLLVAVAAPLGSSPVAKALEAILKEIQHGEDSGVASEKYQKVIN